ncbi:alpha/beta hydrolase [Kineosporia sp. R_H_3]|uniref:alpha/beta hydrolase n=1 Tax=Kineosporia sp. R_H_3 TaxID=1961848 RepID=UPI000B4B6504|nr:alpha/beta hydrolase [Kineosporia sp. R_H_3]
MPLDDPTAGLLANLAAAGPPIHQLSAADARAATAPLAQFYGAGPEMAQAREVTLEVDGGEISLRVLRPTAEPAGVLVYLHGGGWVIGSAAEYDTLGRTLAAATGLTTVLVDYRKAPEHPFPAAVNDSWAALRWVDAHREELAAVGAALVVGGDSAGGNLTAVMTHRARGEGGPQIAAQVLVYPATDHGVRPSHVDPANQLLLDQAGMDWFVGHYLPDPAMREHPEAAPNRVTDLAGLPPAVVLVAEFDVLRDEVEEYADRLGAAGVPVVRRLFEGQMHGFFQFVNVLPGSAAGVTFVAESLAALLPVRAAR